MNKKYSSVSLICISMALLSCGGGGGGSSTPAAPVPAGPTVTPLNFSYTGPDSLKDYESFSITVTPTNLQSGETVVMTLDEESKEALFTTITGTTLQGRAPFTYTSSTLSLPLKLTSSNSRSVTKNITIPITYSASDTATTLSLAFSPGEERANSLQTNNYATWDIFPWVRSERKKVPAGTYCYPTPDNCQATNGESPPGFIPGEIMAGDFDGDGDQDVMFLADIGDRVFKSLGTDADKSYWSTIHILWNDGQGRLSEDLTKYESGSAPRLPAPYRVEIADFNKDGIDDAMIASFGVPILRDDKTNFWKAYPHLLLLSSDGIHKEIQVLQNEAALIKDTPQATDVIFAHDIGAGDIDGDGDIDVMMNAVLYFNDGAGNFEVVNINQTTIQEPWGPAIKKVAATHAHASAIGDFNNDGIDDLSIFWSDLRTSENPADQGYYGAPDWSNVLLGPVNPSDPVYLDSPKWKTLPAPFYGPLNANYNDAASGDLDGDGFDDLVVGSTRKTPYYAGRHVQILMSAGDGTFTDETITRFEVQPRAQLDPTLGAGVTGIGEGVIVLRDIDLDGDLDLVDTTGIFGGSGFEIYPRVTLALNDGTGIFTEVPEDFFPTRMDFSYFDGYSAMGTYGTPVMQRSGVIDLDGNGWLDFVSHIYGNFGNDSSVVSTQSFISKK
jgi:hypothetical protein